MFFVSMERVGRIELPASAWKAEVLPLYDARVKNLKFKNQNAKFWSRLRRIISIRLFYWIFHFFAIPGRFLRLDREPSLF